MSWQDNRRRKRAWYQRFEALSGKLKVILENPEATAADILNMFHSYSQAMRLYKYDWIQISWEIPRTPDQGQGAGQLQGQGGIHSAVLVDAEAPWLE